MATVRAFSIDDIETWFHSGDHEPPHFHAKRKGEWEVRVYFLRSPSEMIDIKWNKKKRRPNGLKTICSLAEENRIQLLEQWEQVHQISNESSDKRKN